MYTNNQHQDADQRESEFNIALDKLLADHGATLLIVEEGDSRLGTTHAVRVTMDGVHPTYDDPFVDTKSYAEFDIKPIVQNF